MLFYGFGVFHAGIILVDADCGLCPEYGGGLQYAIHIMDAGERRFGYDENQIDAADGCDDRAVPAQPVGMSQGISQHRPYH